MKLQVIHNSKGKPTGVYIPINVWKQLKEQNKNLKKLEVVASAKDQIVQELKEAITELKLIEQGKLKARPARELLNEL